MKIFLPLITILFFTACGQPKQELTKVAKQPAPFPHAVSEDIIELQQDMPSIIDRDIIAGEQTAIDFKKEFDIFAEYYETNKLYPYIRMNNKIVALTNKYGMVFVNHKEPALSVEDVSRLGQSFVLEGTQFYSTLFYMGYKDTYDEYYPTLKIHKSISNIFYKDSYPLEEGLQFFNTVANDHEQMGLDEVFNNKYTLWKLVQNNRPPLFSSFEEFIAAYDKITGGAYMKDSSKDINIKKRRYYFLSRQYPIDNPDRFYNALLNFMVYKGWVYGGLNKFVPYDKDIPNLSAQ